MRELQTHVGHGYGKRGLGENLSKEEVGRERVHHSVVTPHYCRGQRWFLDATWGTSVGRRMSWGVTCVVDGKLFHVSSWELFIILSVEVLRPAGCLCPPQSIHGAGWFLYNLAWSVVLFFPLFEEVFDIFCWIREDSCPVFHVHLSMFSSTFLWSQQ